ncbi:glycosyltransferase [Rhodoplanes sp. Z2-YC6860]|uniref:glycosyltransferase n=1 Tax=Rhodoplanes sp. Z2-YC6860 TaxID=674703 RepID=UPI0012ED31DC|nr:glycosyltransferase [Rhodoplanes sp. Z2-YC6860]
MSLTGWNAGKVGPRKVCCVSLSFPPSAAAGVHRVRHVSKFLPNHGWSPTIVCVDERDLNETLDWKLLDLVRKDIKVRRVRALPVKLTKPFGVTDLGLRAYWSVRQELKALLDADDYDAVLMTGAPFYQMALSRYIKRRFRVPVVLDFQDPWVSAWGAAQPMMSKAGITHRLAVSLEPRVLRSADFVTSVSDIQNAEMAGRYPWLDASKMAAIPIGGDPDDFRVLDVGTEDISFPTDMINFSYVGTFLPRAEPLVRVLFRAYSRLRRLEPTLAANIRLNFIGTSNQSNDVTKRVLPVAESEGVANAVSETPHRIPYLQALSALKRSHALLLIGSDEPHYTASKIYPALMSERPYLSFFHRASSAHSILSRARGGRALSFADRDELVSSEVPFSEALRDLALHPNSFGIADPSAYEAYQADNVACQFAAIFDRMSLTRAK